MLSSPRSLARLAGLPTLILCSCLAQALADSYYTQRPNDPKAVYLSRPDFQVAGDGAADDADALQKAIDRVQETSGQGIVFVPEGRYRLSRTVHVWAGIRLIGYGKERPAFVLGEKTPGFQDGDGKYMIHFVSDRPAEGKPIQDANPGTFYSAMSNIDIEIKDGNPAAIGLRFHAAQHCYVAHADFRIGSGRAGIEGVGNEMDDCRFFGGEVGMLAGKTSPSWPFLLIDSSFEGQRRAAIETDEAGLTVVRCQFKDTQSAVAVRENRAEEMWISDSRFENISGPAVVIGDEENARSQTNLRNVACENIPVLVSFRESGRRVAGRPEPYLVREFCHGLQIPTTASEPKIATTIDIAGAEKMPPRQVPSDIPRVPAGDTWTNVAELGAKGDGVTDATDILKKAIAAHRALYFPTGRYLVSDTIELRPDTMLIGLNPITTQLLLADNTPTFSGAGAPKPLLLTPKGGTNIVTGIGLDTGINSRAIAAKWTAGEHSLMNDVRFIGGHGTFLANGMRRPTYNNNRTGDPDPRRPWDSQPYSLWITDGGGGTFKDIWTPNSYAQAGACISDTSTPGRIYAMSLEHHVRNELKIRGVSNWKIFALQTEEERGEGPDALPVSIVDSHDITIANLFLYRVESEAPFRDGVRVQSSSDITFFGLHAYSPGKFTFDNTVFDETSGTEIREREIALLKIAGAVPERAADARIKKCAGGFNNIDGAVADKAGNVYFVDARWNRIYRWSPADRDLKIIRDTPIGPVSLAFDTRGNLIVPTRNGTVYAFDPDGKEDAMTALEPQPSAARNDGRPMITLNAWRDDHDFLAYMQEQKPWQFVAPDGVTYLPAGNDFVKPARGQRHAVVDLYRTYALAPALAGSPFYVSDEFGHKTWAFSASSDGSLATPKLFAEEGEAGTAVDREGNVYVAAGNIHVYDKTGRKIETIRMPERPTSLVFGGPDRRTLFVAARTSLYAIRRPGPAVTRK